MDIEIKPSKSEDTASIKDEITITLEESQIKKLSDDELSKLTKSVETVFKAYGLE